jgi:hypothetical protein
VKSLLLSIAIGFVVVTIYTTAAAVCFVLSGENMALVPYLDLPMRLPKVVKAPVYRNHISEFESGKREPSLLVLLQYARSFGVVVDVLIDDKLELK